MYNLFHTKFNYNINSLQAYLKKATALHLEDFEQLYTSGREYFFVAYPKE